MNAEQKNNKPVADWTRKEMKGIPASLGAIWTRRDGESWRYAIKLDDSHANAQGYIHGGVMMTFMDHALSLLVWEKSGRAQCATVQLDNHFLSGVRAPAFLELEAEITKQGVSMAFARGVLKHADKPVMEATGIWSIASAKSR